MAAVGRPPEGRAGIRIARCREIQPQLQSGGVIGAVASAAFGDRCRPVRVVLFDKSAGFNWALGWHQDRTICVEERREVAGFGPWTVKDSRPHVEPPFEIIENMFTLRVHLDDVASHNGPLLIAPGSHRLGRVPVEAIEAAVRGCGTHACTARAGDVWIYSTPILHASERAARPARRRVLQIDYSRDELPDGLCWAGI